MKAVYTSPSGSSYDHDDQPIRILQYDVDHSYKDDATGARYLGATRTIAIEWEIRASTQSALSTKMAAAEAAYEENATEAGGSLIVKQDNGSNSRHTMPASEGSGGVGTRVVKFGYREASGVEYATLRTAYAILTHGAIIDLEEGGPIGPSNPGAEFDEGTDLQPYDWDEDEFAGGFPGGGGGGSSSPYGRTESYSVSGGDPTDVVEEMPTGSPYIWRKTERSKRIERHEIEIVARTQFAAIPPTIISAGGAAIKREVRFGKARGNPPQYTTSVVYTKES